jgi:hypothetical protein
LVLLLMVLTAILGAITAWAILPGERQREAAELLPPTEAMSQVSPTILVEAAPSATLPPFAFIPTRTLAPTLTPWPSATPTSQALFGGSPTPRRVAGFTLSSTTPTPFIIPPSPTPIRNQAESPGERFAFFAQNSAMPRSLNVIEIACDADQSRFTLVFDPTLDSNLPYLEVSLSAAGPDAVFSELTPLVTSEMQIVQDLTLTLNDSALNLNDVRSSQIFVSIFQSAWERERLGGVRAFSATWTETSLQPAMSFRIVAQHPNSGGVMMSVRWARDPQERLEDNERLTFQVC